jgi:hypothetical protein
MVEMDLTPYPDVRLHGTAILWRYARHAPEEAAMQINEHVGQVQSRAPSRTKRRAPKDSIKPMKTPTERVAEPPMAHLDGSRADEGTTRELPRYGAGF